MRVTVLRVALVLAVLPAAVTDLRAQKTDSFHRVDMPNRRAAESRPLRVGERMAAQMVDEMIRFRGVPHDSALKLLYTQTRHHMIVMSQCDFELHLSRQNASPAWQALSDSVARDTRRVIVKRERLNNSEINEVLNRAARMARFCMGARSSW